MLYLARFAEMNDCIVDAPDPETAVRVLAECVTDAPIGLQELPPGVFCCEVRWESDDDVHEPANFTSSGIALEPFDPLATYLETQANSEAVAAHMIAVAPDASG